MNEQNRPERVPLGELYQKAETPEQDRTGETETEAKTKSSRLERLEQKKAQLENQIKAIHARENEKQRHERTRRLIQIGAISVKYLSLPDTIEPAAFEKVMQRVVATLEQKSAKPPQEEH